MADNPRKNKKQSKLLDNSEPNKASIYAKASYFEEKDKKAAAFLKKHPLPGKFLK